MPTKIKPAMAQFVGGLPESPEWEHDCPTCIWLMTRDKVDLYLCPYGGLMRGGPSRAQRQATIIARTGSEPEAYASGLGFANTNPFLALAYNCAKSLGLLSEASIKEAEYRWIEGPANV